MKKDRAGDAVQGVTSALDPLSADQAHRFRIYAIQMTIRTGCFFGAVFIDHWIRWVLAVGAVVLPYIAVILVNAGRDHVERSVEQVPREQIGPSLSTPQATPGSDDTEGSS